MPSSITCIRQISNISQDGFKMTAFHTGQTDEIFLAIRVYADTDVIEGRPEDRLYLGIQKEAVGNRTCHHVPFVCQRHHIEKIAM